MISKQYIQFNNFVQVARAVSMISVTVSQLSAPTTARPYNYLSFTHCHNHIDRLQIGDGPSPPRVACRYDDIDTYFTETSNKLTSLHSLQYSPNVTT